MNTSEIRPGMRVYHNKSDGYYTTGLVNNIMADGRVSLSGGDFADPKDLDPKPDRGRIGGRELAEGTPVFDSQQNEVFYYCHKLDNTRAARLNIATPKQLDQLRNVGKLTLSLG